MKRSTIIILVIILALATLIWNGLKPEVSPVAPTYTAVRDKAVDSQTATHDTSDYPRTEVIAEGLSIPWEIIFLPDGELLVTERPGRILLLKEGLSIPISGVRHVGEGGLLGAALHPDFSQNNFLYLFQTTEMSEGLTNRIDRYTLVDSDLTFDRTIIDGLPGAQYHDGGRIKFGSDGYLYVTLGDAGDEAAAQETEDVAGSILRYTSEGDIAEGNPFANAIYSFGHRNPQGLAWDSMGNLWSTEHGRSGLRSGYDEINRIIVGQNYGWPNLEGDEVETGFTAPVRHSGASTTWAPGGLAYLNGYLYIPGLKGETLYRARLEGEDIVSFDEYFVGEYGRLRTIVVGPDNMLYLTTSNRDGRGDPTASDDRIIRINPSLLGEE